MKTVFKHHRPSLIIEYSEARGGSEEVDVSLLNNLTILTFSSGGCRIIDSVFAQTTFRIDMDATYFDKYGKQIDLVDYEDAIEIETAENLVENLVEMGFSRDKAQKAVVEVTGNIGVETAVEWILSHPDEPAAETPQPTTQSTPQQMETSSDQVSSDSAQPAVVSEGPEVVRSYKCDDCQKQFKNAEQMEYHAAVKKHTNFSELTEETRPLTDEEKQEQMKRIDEKLKKKRAEREDRENKEEVEREKMRVRSGKELAEAKRRLEEQEIKDIVEARSREKVEDKKARDRVKAKIEADKIARKAKYAAATSTSTTEPVASSTPQPLSLTNSNSDFVSPPKKDYKETKLQLRLPNGKTLTQTFGCNEPLASVRLYVELNRNDGLTGPFNLMTSFPKKVYDGDDYDIPLEALGLVPSAVLMVTKTA